MSNHPDDCQGPDTPWNEEDIPSCPEVDCGAHLIIHCNTKDLTDIECSECDYTLYIERFDDDL